MILFHDDCFGCTQQDKHGINFCHGCCYFDGDWDKPSLRREPLDKVARQTVTATMTSHNFCPGELLTVVAPDRRWWRRAWFRLLRRGEPKRVFQGRITKATANTLNAITTDKP